MLVFDFFAGTGSSTRAFEDAGHTVISFDNDSQFDVTVLADVSQLTASALMERFGRPDFIWASPPCTSFSVASIGHHWYTTGQPKTWQARVSMELVYHTRQLLETMAPRYGFLIENPRGMLRKLSPVDGLHRQTVTYCQYGDSRMKPTDLWGEVPGWVPRPPCKNGDKCHTAAPRGARTGTQGISGARDRSRVPYALGAEILEAIEGEK
jgi:hypothetical protein